MSEVAWRNLRDGYGVVHKAAGAWAPRCAQPEALPPKGALQPTDAEVTCYNCRHGTKRSTAMPYTPPAGRVT